MLTISEPSTNFNLFEIVTSKITDHRSHNKYNINESLKYCKNCQNVTQRRKVSKCCWKNGPNRLAQRRVATNLQVVINVISVKLYKVKCSKTRCACMYPLGRHPGPVLVTGGSQPSPIFHVLFSSNQQNFCLMRSIKRHEKDITCR